MGASKSATITSPLSSEALLPGSRLVDGKVVVLEEAIEADKDVPAD